MAQMLPEQWQVGKTLNECNQYMLENEFEYNDVTFRVRCKHQDKGHAPVDIPALQLLLMARSPVFYAMFAGDLASQDHSKPIEVDDIEPDAFKEMLRFIYTDKVNLTNENVTGVLYASKKYIVTNLTTKCLQFLEARLTADSAPQILEQSMLYDEKDLKNKALSVIKRTAPAVLSSQNFIHVSKDILHEILQLNLQVSKEIEVFEATMKWATNKCEELGQVVNGTNLRQALGEDIYLLRILALSIDDFNRIVLPLEVLTTTEALEIFRYMTDKSYQSDGSPFRFGPRAGFKEKLIPGPYATRRGSLLRSEKFLITTNLECQLSKPIWLNKIFIHGCEMTYGLQHILFVSVEQNKKILFTFNGTHRTNPMATGNAPQYSVAVPGVRLAAGELQLNIQLSVSLKSSGSHIHGTYTVQMSPSHAKISDDYMSLTFPPNTENILLGIGYCPFSVENT